MYLNPTILLYTSKTCNFILSFFLFQNYTLLLHWLNFLFSLFRSFNRLTLTKYSNTTFFSVIFFFCSPPNIEFVCQCDAISVNFCLFALKKIYFFDSWNVREIRNPIVSRYESSFFLFKLMWIFFCYIFSWKKNKEVKMYQPNIEPKSLVCCFVWLIFAVAWRSAPNTHPVCVSSPLRIIFCCFF